MAKIKTRKITLSSSMSVAPSQGSGVRYGAIPEGFYTAVVKDVKEGSYLMNFKSYGKQQMQTLSPDLHITYENEVWSFSRHDLNIGTVDAEGFLFRPDGNSSKSPIWGGSGGALFFLKELGCLIDNDDGTYELSGDTDTLSGRILRVKMVVESYCKADRRYNMVNSEFKVWLNEGYGVSVSGSIDAIHAAVGEFNKENDLDMSIKSVPVAFYALTPKFAEEGGFYHDNATHQTYVNEQAYELSVAMADLDEGEESF